MVRGLFRRGDAPSPGGAAEAAPKKAGWLGRLRGALSKSSDKLTSGLADILGGRRLDADSIEELEEVLISADLGPTVAHRLAGRFAEERFKGEPTAAVVRPALAGMLTEILEPVVKPLAAERAAPPHVVLVVGVNGTGKTTTIGKLAHWLKGRGLSVMVAAGDTFRAAAVEQLEVWGERAGVPVVSHGQGADAAAVAFDAVEAAEAGRVDVLLIDTAGRLHNKKALMGELEKVVRVVGRACPGAPHERVLVLDATTGQNAIAQVETFKEMIDVTGLVVTKLDGSAKGGVLFALVDRFGLPVHAVGVGEGIDDLRPFDAADFARSFVGLEP